MYPINAIKVYTQQRYINYEKIIVDCCRFVNKRKHFLYYSLIAWTNVWNLDPCCRCPSLVKIHSYCRRQPPSSAIKRIFVLESFRCTWNKTRGQWPKDERATMGWPRIWTLWPPQLPWYPRHVLIAPDIQFHGLRGQCGLQTASYVRS